MTQKQERIIKRNIYLLMSNESAKMPKHNPVTHILRAGNITLPLTGYNSLSYIEYFTTDYTQSIIITTM